MRRYKNMIKVLFVCLGNICRSPMAEFIFKDMIKKQGIGKGKSRLPSRKEKAGRKRYRLRWKNRGKDDG